MVTLRFFINFWKLPLKSKMIPLFLTDIFIITGLLLKNPFVFAESFVVYLYFLVNILGTEFHAFNDHLIFRFANVVFQVFDNDFFVIMNANY